jgi:DNA-binding SARP family transcriptional activator
MDIRLQTLGGLRVFRDGGEITSLSRKPVRAALLVYLAVERSASREHLATLLWPDRPPDRARRSLNNTVYELRSDLGPDAITTRGDTVTAAEWIRTDFHELRALADGGQDPGLPSLVGRFLEGSHLVASSEFEHWVDVRTSEARRLQISILRGRTEELHRTGNLSEALDTAATWAAAAPMDEDAHHWLIRLIAENGRRADAIVTFERFRRHLRDELDLEPSETLVELVEQIQAGSLGSATPFSLESPPVSVSTPNEVWRPEQGWSGKLLKALGLYAAVGAGLLEVLDYLIGYWGLPESFLPAAMVLIALGLPIVAITAFLESQPVLRRDLRGLRFLLARWFSWRNATLAATAAAAAWTTAVVGYRLAERIRDDGSIVVVPFQSASSSDAERQLADQIAGEIALQLADWDAVRVVPSIAIAGPMFDLGLEGPTLRSRDDGVALAASLRASNLAAVITQIRGDSLHVSVDVVNSRNGRAVRTPVRASGSSKDLAGISANIVHGLLGFDTLGVEVDELDRGTRHREAFLADVAGQRHLAHWELEEAEEDFRYAIDVDPDFALAHLHLAQTLYWGAARSSVRLEEAGGRIHSSALLAMERRAGLSDRDRLRIEGFYAFETGDWKLARAAYHDLLDMDPTDVTSWLMMGSVEYRDPVLVVGPEGVARPRADLNAARRAFVESLRLQPAFALGYGHLFDIQGLVEGYDRGCPGFEPESAPRRAIWEELREPVPGSLPFCAVAFDSIEWVQAQDFGQLDPDARTAGADRLLRDAASHLVRWSAFDPTNPAPHDYLASVWITLRARMRIASPEELASMADSARHHTVTAIQLRGDTTVVELGELSALYLASDDNETALALADRAHERFMAAEGEEAVPLGAVNAFMATGDVRKALDLAGARDVQAFQPDPENGSYIALGGAEHAIDRLLVLGAMGVQGEPVRAELATIEDIWGRGSYTERERKVLRDALPPQIATALVQDMQLAHALDARAEVEDSLWRIIVDGAGSPENGLGRIRAADPPLTRDQEIFAKATAMVRIGAVQEGLRLFARLDSIPLRPAALDHGWGLRGRARYERARLEAEAGNTDRARTLAGWALSSLSRPSPLLAPMIEELEDLAGSQGAGRRTGPS